MNIDGYKIEIVRSKSRKKTIQARLTGGKDIRVLAPYRADEEFLLNFIKKTVKKFSAKDLISGKGEDLKERAEMLRKKYIPKAPNFTISYSESLRSTWGKCFFGKREIVLNPKLSHFPLWVVDMVIIHELAHLIYPNHGKEFRALVSKYRLKERATGYLYAKGINAKDI